MVQSMGSQRVGHVLTTEHQQGGRGWHSAVSVGSAGKQFLKMSVLLLFFFSDFLDADQFERLYCIWYNIAPVFCASGTLAVRPRGSQLSDQRSNPPPPASCTGGQSQPLDFQGSLSLLYFEDSFFKGPSLILCSLQYLPQTCLNIKNEIQSLWIKEIDE